MSSANIADKQETGGAEGSFIDTLSSKITQAAAAAGLAPTTQARSEVESKNPEITAAASQAVDGAKDEQIGEFLRDK